MKNNYIQFYLKNTFKYLDYNIQALAYNYSFGELNNKNLSTTLQKWRRLDNRYTDLFGSTYEIPLSVYKQHDEAIRVLISGDRFLQCSSTRLNIFDITDITGECKGVGEVSSTNLYIDTLDTMDTILPQAYPNADIQLLGDFDKTSTFEADLTQLLNYLNNKIAQDEALPTHIIFNGLEKTYATFGYTKTYEIYSSILEICSKNNIRIVCVLCGNNYMSQYTYEEIFTPDLVKLSNLLSNSYVINLYQWLEHRKVSYNHAVNFVDVLYGIQMDISYNYIYDKCFEALGLDVFREKYYVSFVNMEINAPTTMNTITDSVYATDFYFKSTFPVPAPHDPPIIPHYFTKYCGGETQINSFKNSGEFVAIVVHTKYNDTLFASEQFQANCNEEFVAQNNKYSSKGSLQNLLKMRYWTTGYIISEQGYFDVPVYPTAGAPWLTVSVRNLNDYKNENVVNPYTPIGIWLTRDNYNMTITTNLAPIADDKPSLYHSVVFGCLSFSPINHVYSLYCGGGTGGLCQDIYVHPNISSGILTYTAGNVYDLDMDNIAMSNANILHTTYFNGSNTSNFRVLSPNGVWQSIFSHSQQASVVNFPTLSDPVDFAYVLGGVTDHTSHNIYPRLQKDYNRLSSKYIKSNGYMNVTGKNELMKSNAVAGYMQSIRILLNPVLDNNEHYSTGIIPHCFMTWDDECPSGEVELNGKKYLSIPCGWDGRLYDYNTHHIGIVNNVWNTEIIVDDWEARTAFRKENVIRDKLLIELG